MLILTNGKIKGIVQTKFIGRTIQYMQFKYNGKRIIFVNVHMSPEGNPGKRIKVAKKLLKFVNKFKKDIYIIAGDFNTKPNEIIYKMMLKDGYKSVVKEFMGKEQLTYPSDNPDRCLDYIWVKGKVIIKNVELTKESNATDHVGIKAVLDIK
jgi:endonuclease/exonuclease/phosphatase family metal-dependent hydrolase